MSESIFSVLKKFSASKKNNGLLWKTKSIFSYFYSSRLKYPVIITWGCITLVGFYFKRNWVAQMSFIKKKLSKFLVWDQDRIYNNFWNDPQHTSAYLWEEVFLVVMILTSKYQPVLSNIDDVLCIKYSVNTQYFTWNNHTHPFHHYSDFILLLICSKNIQIPSGCFKVNV